MNNHEHALTQWRMTRKVFGVASFFLVLLCATVFFLHGEDNRKPINAFNGRDWCAWTYPARYTFILGFLVGSYTTQQGAGNMGFLDAKEVDYLQIILPRGISVDEIVADLDAFYASEDKLIPLTVAFVRRNDRDLGSWKTLSRNMKGWNYHD